MFDGAAQGEVLRLDAPISFWGGVDPVSSRITRPDHPQHGIPIADTLLVVAELIGSSSSSAVMLELLHTKRAPRALILGQRDAILPIGVLAAGQMSWPTIPVLLLPDPPFRTGDVLAIQDGGRIDRV